MLEDKKSIVQSASDPFGLGHIDFSIRVPEKSEMFDATEAKLYIDGCDYPESADDLLLALEIQSLFGYDEIRSMSILDTMCGPGRLGRELLTLGADQVVFHDGHQTMLENAKEKASHVTHPRQKIATVLSPVENITLPDNSFDLVVCHNSTHQLSNLEKLRIAMKEFLRVATPGGHIVIADYQRATSPDYLRALEERLQYTKPEIVPLLIPTFKAAFSKDEFADILLSMPGIKSWTVTDAQAPNGLSLDMINAVNADPIKGHFMDYSSISLRAVVEKR